MRPSRRPFPDALRAELARGAEDAVPGAVGSFEELLDGSAPVEDDLVRVGRRLLESLGEQARSRDG